MPVFKVSLKVLKRNLPSILIYLGVFLALSVLFARNAQSQGEEYSSFDPVKTPMAVFAEEDTPLIRGFLAHLEKSAVIRPLEDEENLIQDALYFRNISFLVRIPKGFTEAFLRQEEVTLGKTVVPGSVSSIYTELAIDTYFNTARMILAAAPNLTSEELAEKVEKALAQTTPITLKSYGTEASTPGMSRYFFNYMAYSLVSILVLGTSLVMLVWKDLDLYRRTEISPLRRSRISLEKYLALGVFTLITWGTLILTYYVLYRGESRQSTSILFVINSFILAFTSLGMSFLIGTLMKSRNAISGVSNVLSLGPSFISGVFVPQELLGAGVLALAHVTPTYWYVTANGLISTLGSLQDPALSRIFSHMAVVAAFGLGFFALASFLGRRQTRM